MRLFQYISQDRRKNRIDGASLWPTGLINILRKQPGLDRESKVQQKEWSVRDWPEIKKIWNCGDGSCMGRKRRIHQDYKDSAKSHVSNGGERPKVAAMLKSKTLPYLNDVVWVWTGSRMNHARRTESSSKRYATKHLEFNSKVIDWNLILTNKTAASNTIKSHKNPGKKTL